MKTIIAGLIISLALALAPAPKITVDNPDLLYAAAMYKTALGDTDSALQLIHRAEQARQSARPDANILQAACDRSSLLTIL
jgi:hypothetical protein